MAARPLLNRIATSLVAALMFGVAATVLLGVASFIAAQPTSMLRLAILLPAHEIRFAWVGALVTGVAFTLLVRAPRSHLAAAVVALTVALGGWWGVQQPSVSRRILPPIRGK